ncbi:hypothetical protein K488DRAFT_83617 [Vararia minispora EC-137]|uniref:Uncharacterized protein n=1 Tax=Vararia minispora EC-137 TaxID=1314806 RepID=A0ACB8QTK8_9AGAM|nr:hypothetical protein K488DRAFT_83617 [Vararia minispora EC-137]
MLPQSSVFGVFGSGDVIILSDGVRRILVQVPQTFDDLVNTAKVMFKLEDDDLLFETDDLNVCRGGAVEIHSSSWESVRSVIGTLTITRHNQRENAGPSARRSLAPISVPQLPSASIPDVKPLSVPRTFSSRPLLNRAISPPLDTDAGEDGLYPPSSLDDEDLYDENDEVAEPQPSPSKGKGKGRARKQVLSSDEEEEGELWHSSSLRPSGSKAKPLSSRVGSYASPMAPASPTGKVRGTPCDVMDMFSPNVKKAVVRQTPVPDDTEEEEENDENVAPPTLRLVGSSKSSATSISKSINPEVRSVKKTPHKSGNYIPDDEVSPSPRPKVSGTTPGLKHAPAHSSFLRESVTDFDDKPTLEPLPSLRETAPLPEEKILIVIKHPESGNESKFKIKGKHLVQRVLTSACNAFQLDVSRAHLVLVEDIDGIEMTTECRRDQTMVKAGVKNESQLKIVLLDEDDEETDD